MNDSGARVLFVGTELMPVVSSVRDRLARVEHVIEVTPDGGPADAYDAWLAGSEPLARPETTDPEDVCLVMYSSGTTGRPKGVMLTHTNMVRHTLNAHEGWGFDPGDKNLVAMPLFHVGGSSYILFGIHDGVPSVMTRDPDGASLAGCDHAGREPDLPGARGARAGAAVRAGRDRAIRQAEDLLLRRVADAAAAVAGGHGGLAGHRVHPGLRAHRGGRGDHAPDARRTPGRRAPGAAGECRPGDPRGRAAGGRPRDARGRADRRGPASCGSGPPS